MWNNNLEIVNIRDKRGVLGKQLCKAVKFKFKQNFSAKALRRMFYELLRMYRTELQDRNKQIQPHEKMAGKSKLWCFEQLKFMHEMAKEMQNKKPIVLSQKQLIQMCEIYEQFPVLWNWTQDNTHCLAQRRETNVLLLNKINEEMHLNFSSTDLQYRITRLKRLYIKNKRLRIKCKSKNLPFKPYKPQIFEKLKYLEHFVGPIECEQCPEQFENRISHLKHVAEVHEGRQRSFKCPDCDQEFSQFGHLVSHRRKHTGENLLSCELCPKTFTSTSLLKKHMHTHTGQKNFICDICGAGFYYHSKLAVHKIKHDPSKFQFKCQFCGRKFAVAYKLKDHMAIHENRRSHVCQECGKGFNQRKTLWEHMKTHKKGKV